MKRILTFSLFTFTLSFFARADLLYFMTSSYNAAGDWQTYNFDYAMVGVAKKGDVNWNNGSKTYLYIQPTWESSAGASLYLASQSDGTPWYVEAGPAWADVSDYTTDGYTFYVETYKSGAVDPIWGYSQETAQSYAQLLAAGHIYTDSMSVQDVTAWVAVPEPSSGLLLLLGIAGLALRRRVGADHRAARIAVCRGAR